MTDQELAAQVAKLNETVSDLLKRSNDYAGRITHLEQRLVVAEATIKQLKG